MRIHFYVNQFGNPDVAIFGYNPILATFLIDEIGFAPSSDNSWIGEIVKGINLPDYYSSGTGNAHTLTVMGSRIKLTNEFVLENPEVECSGERLLEFIKLWLSFLANRQERVITFCW